MLSSDTISDKTSSTLPIIISFTSNLKKKGIKKIRDFLHLHPRCQDYVKKGPNFVADGINEFRLYYVDSALYQNKKTLKKLNIEKEEILFSSQTADSLEQSTIPSEKNNRYGVSNTILNVETKLSIEMIDQGTMCEIYDEYICSECSLKYSQITKKISKSFQIGPDLRFNVVYVNTEINPFGKELTFMETGIQTDFVEATDTTNSTVQECPSLYPIEKKIEKFNNYITKIEEKRDFSKYKKSEINIESTTTSLKFSIKKSPSFVADYLLDVFKNRRSSNQIDQVFGKTFVNYVENHRVNGNQFYEVSLRNDYIATSASVFKTNFCNKIRKNPYKKEKHFNNQYKTHTRKAQYNNFQKYIHPIVKYGNFHKIDKLNRYINVLQRPKCYEVEFLFKCTNMDFFLRRSHYAILKGYHEKLKKRKNKHKHRIMDDKNEQYKKNKNKKKDKKKKYTEKVVESKTTISGFLYSYRPWHWMDNSKLSICIDEDCFTEEEYLPRWKMRN